MPVVYHPECCPLMARELAHLILQAYRIYYETRAGLPLPEFVETETGRYDLRHVVMAKALKLGRFKPFGFVATRGETAYLIFRGTESVSEWVGDGKIIQVRFRDDWGKVHRGFKAIYETCAQELLPLLESLSQDYARLCIAGHSLGGALSTLACAEASEVQGFSEIFHYTYASPRVGNLAFSQKFDQANIKSYRFMNTEDLITSEPKAATMGPVYQYAHVGIPLAFTHHGGSILNNHFLESYMLHL